MSVFLSVVIMLLMLGVLITVHELGHFLTARLCGIRVREFAIGMGPVVFRKKPRVQAAVTAEGDFLTGSDEAGALENKGTIFTLRALPVGGFCDMTEDEESDDPAHFRNKKAWQKGLVLVSGALMNLLLGFIIMLVLSCLSVGRVADQIPVIASVDQSCPYDFREGDQFYSVNGHRIYTYNDLNMFFPASDQIGTFVMLRDGEKITLSNLSRLPFPVFDENGDPVPDGQGGQKTEPRFGITIGYLNQEITWGDVPRQSFLQTYNSVRLVWFSLGQLISGRAGANDLMGFVGMGGAVNDMITHPQATPMTVLLNVLWLAGLVAVNLAIVNLLPIPALDGGRIVFLFISAFLVLVRKRPLSAKVEGYIHGVTMLLLFALMIFIFFNDIRRLTGL